MQEGNVECWPLLALMAAELHAPRAVLQENMHLHITLPATGKHACRLAGMLSAAEALYWG